MKRYKGYGSLPQGAYDAWLNRGNPHEEEGEEGNVEEEGDIEGQLWRPEDTWTEEDMRCSG